MFKNWGILHWSALILGLLAIGFFSAGLINPTLEYRAEVEINHPRDTVWSMFQNDTLISKWVTEVDSFALIEGTENEPGSLYRMWIESQGQSFVLDQELTAYRSPEFIAFHYNEFGMDKTDTYTFKSTGNKTSIVGNFNVQADGYFSRCLYAFMEGYFEQVDQRYLDNFKQLVEDEL